ncbi:helix-turn-helix transcriptional regulator [Micrococcus luteus]|uniref:helix-turn-helix transcriptional regulator n=1 Tax=Micrococcus luteus TaxID=1270 RepID=UPI00387A16DE
MSTTARDWTQADGLTVRNAREVVTLSPSDLSARWGVPVKTVYTWRTTGYGPRGFRVGKYLRYRLEDVEAWEAAQIAAEDDR